LSEINQKFVKNEKVTALNKEMTICLVVFSLGAHCTIIERTLINVYNKPSLRIFDLNVLGLSPKRFAAPKGPSIRP